MRSPYPLLLLLVACSGGQDWVRDGADVWWGDDPVGEPAPSTRPPPPAGSASRPPAPAPMVSAGRRGEVYRNTYYDFPDEREVAAGPKATVYDASCEPIAEVAEAFHDALCVQGSGRLRSGATVSFAKRDCDCARVCPRTDQRICFEALDPKRFPHGRGARGTPITPLRSVAVDPDVIPLGEVLYIPMFQGLRGPTGAPHDGCFIAEDRGLKVVGRHVDIFTGSPSTTASWNRAVPSNQGVEVIVGASRCAHLQQE